MVDFREVDFGRPSTIEPMRDHIITNVTPDKPAVIQIGPNVSGFTPEAAAEQAVSVQATINASKPR